MPKLDELIAQADEIVRNIQNGNLVLTPEARKTIISKTVGKGLWGRELKEAYPLSALVANEVSNFLRVRSIQCGRAKGRLPQDLDTIRLRSVKQRRLIEISCNLIEYIEYARANGLVENRDSMGKLKEYEEQNRRLKDKVDKLQKENQKLHQTLKRFGKAGFVGDVTTNKEG